MPLLTENVEITSTRLNYQASCEVRYPYLEREAMVGDNNVVGKELHAGWDEMGRFVWCVPKRTPPALPATATG